MLIHQRLAALVTAVWGPGSQAGSASPADGCGRLGSPARAIQGLASPWPSPEPTQGSPAPAPAPPVSLPALHVLGLCLIQPGSGEGCGARAPGSGRPEVRQVALPGQRPESGQGLNQQGDPSWDRGR